MLKIFTIYSIILIIWTFIACVCKIIKSNKIEKRISYFISIVLYFPILYVLVKMLKML